jgi:hypothetical protein
MNEFVFLYRNGGQAMSPEQIQQTLPKWAAWFQALGGKGCIVDRGQPLQRSGKLVGRTVTDGPFAEAKDVVGGYTLIKARDIAEASDFAKGCPIIERGGHVEVRPVMKLDM